MNLKQQTISGLRWSVLQNWGSQFGSLLVFLVLARLLTPEAFGLVALANVFRSFLQMFMDQGFVQALVQRDELEPGHLDTAFWAQLAAGVALAGICLAIAAPVADYFQQPSVAPVLQVLSLVMIVNSFGQVQRALLRRRFEFRTLAMASLIGIAASGIVGVPMALMGFGVWSLVGQQLVFDTVSTAIIWTLSHWRPGRNVSRRHFDDLVGFGIHVVGFRVVDFVSRRADHLLISFFLGEVALGFYSVAHRVLEVMTQVLVYTTRQVVFPAFSRLQADPARLRDALTQALRFTSLATFPIFLGTAAVASQLVPLVFGPQWLEATSLVQILSVSGIVVTLTTSLEMLLLATGQPARRLRLGVLTAAITLPACAIAVQWGIVAVAIAYVATRIAMLPIVYRAAVGTASPETPLRTIAPSLFGAAIMALTLLWMGPERIAGSMALALVVEVAAGAAIYALAIYLFAPKLFSEMRELAQMALHTEPAVDP